MVGNLMAGSEASRDSGARFYGVPSHGSLWYSTTTAWAKTRWATETGNLDAAASIRMTASKLNTMTARKDFWTRWHSHSQEIWAANTAARGPASVLKVRQSSTIQIASTTLPPAVNRPLPAGWPTTVSGFTRTFTP